MIWGGIPKDIEFVRNSNLFKDGLVRFEAGEWRIYWETEIWKDIKGFEGAYQCSSHGRVKSLSRKFIRATKKTTEHKEREVVGRILKYGYDKDGYRTAHLSFGNVSIKRHIHRLVYETFVGERNGILNHMDGVKTNNHYWNLEIVTNRENIAHYYKDKTNKKYVGVEPRGKRFRAKTQYKGKTLHLGTFDTEDEARNAYLSFVFAQDKSFKYL